MKLTEREDELAELADRADIARAERGCVVVVRGESGAGKTSLVEAFLDTLAGGEVVLRAACDPLPTPRPLGPIHDIAGSLGSDTRQMLRGGGQAYDIFSAVFEDLVARPSVVVLDDLHWADQGTIDLLRFVLRRIRRTRSLVIAIVRDDELSASHPVRSLLGDVARSDDASMLSLPPLSLDAVTGLVGDRDIDAAWLHRITAGNAFFITEMLDHSGLELPTTVRDVILARTVGLDDLALDALHLLACAPGPVPYPLFDHLGVGPAALQALDAANLTQAGPRGAALRHDLCRLAVASVIPPGLTARLHQRMIEAYDAVGQQDPAVLTHHAVGAGDFARVRDCAREAGRAAARAGAHVQAMAFYEIALRHGGVLPPDIEAELLELVAGEYYFADRLEDAIAACRSALGLREQLGCPRGLSASHQALALYEWKNSNRAVAEHHAEQAATVFGATGEPADVTDLVTLGHAFAMQAYLAVHATDVQRASSRAAAARLIADRTGDSALLVRIGLIEGFCAVLAGDDAGRDGILSVIRSAPKHLDEIYSGGYSNLAYLDVEHRRLDEAAQVLEVGLPLTVDRDLSICRVWQLGVRARLELLRGEWDEAVIDADTVLASPTMPLARTWPLLIGSIVAMRRGSADLDALDAAWGLARRFGEPFRLLAAASVIVERAWLTDEPDDRLDECRALLEDPPMKGLEWSRGELAMWLRRLDGTCDAIGVAKPYRLLLDGQFDAAADEFICLSTPYDAALALIDSGDTVRAREALDVLDRLGADATAAKVRRDLRSAGANAVPARRRPTTLANAAGLTVRQVDVLRLIDDGLTNPEIAKRLYLSVKTVGHHVSAILAKLDAENRSEAAARARATGLLG
ncbi:LuxR family transcriptional regulator [Mycobacterium sp. ACS4331]|uniref:helix-turn-helix transcriptional regulator n=1 Tax=Mycobacterium sp. ACS4331 TaxID=1834121 RepID=UPI0007FDB6CE|nr:LuxR family transcriptional regulator [Mycobacterium sp. ACS4331]OBF12388.1 LuxR family transcriptional regulator [Mycobacterium sp. ACS4331]